MASEVYDRSLSEAFLVAIAGGLAAAKEARDKQQWTRTKRQWPTISGTFDCRMPSFSFSLGLFDGPLTILRCFPVRPRGTAFRGLAIFALIAPLIPVSANTTCLTTVIILRCWRHRPASGWATLSIHTSILSILLTSTRRRPQHSTSKWRRLSLHSPSRWA